MAIKHRINNFIRSESVRLIGPQGENFGVVATRDAIDKAQQMGFDLVEISPNAVPPIAKIVDYGKFLYSENKKQKSIKSFGISSGLCTCGPAWIGHQPPIGLYKA